MSNESMNYIRKLAGEAYLHGAASVFEWLEENGTIRPGSVLNFVAITAIPAAKYAKRLVIDKKALRCANSERARGEEGFGNLLAETTTPDASSQLPPLAADLEGLAVSLGVLAGRVSAEQWEFLRIFRANLRSAAERVAALENSLEVPHERA